MLKSRLEYVHVAAYLLVGLCYCIKGNYLIFVLEILIEEHSVVELLLSLYHIPICKAVKTLLFEVVGKVQIKICRIKFLVYLLIEKLFYFLIHHKMKSSVFDFVITLYTFLGRISVTKSQSLLAQRKIFFGKVRRGRAVGNGGNYLTESLGSYVARNENSFDRGFRGLVGDNVAVRVKL